MTAKEKVSEWHKRKSAQLLKISMIKSFLLVMQKQLHYAFQLINFHKPFFALSLARLFIFFTFSHPNLFYFLSFRYFASACWWKMYFTSSTERRPLQSGPNKVRKLVGNEFVIKLLSNWLLQNSKSFRKLEKIFFER